MQLLDTDICLVQALAIFPKKKIGKKVLNVILANIAGKLFEASAGYISARLNSNNKKGREDFFENRPIPFFTGCSIQSRFIW